MFVHIFLSRAGPLLNSIGRFTLKAIRKAGYTNPVIPELDPGIHAVPLETGVGGKAHRPTPWMAGSSPAMTRRGASPLT